MGKIHLNIMQVIFGTLPESIKTCISIDVFKSLLKTWEGVECQCKMCTVLC